MDYDDSPVDDNVALVDLDGTVADFDSEMKRRLSPLCGPNEPDYGGNYDDDVPPYIKARRDLIKRQPGFWSGLSTKLGFDVVTCLRSVGFKLNVLTECPKKNPMVWTEKVQWCAEFIPDA